ncbi:acyl-CoA dehydrogenase [Flagellimonas marinaquae]|uniref:acyl-CoA dehydrogenase n=1 Tax=Flagellimonas marinaquae TaxID=254955 RepID=UPI002074F3F2|nr:acyl-CoA dehydrogenase [Allomuricauda aquimarina]USD24449.1 acyl-CoA dehydrogenase [Allomuricauda aquimarina]
MKVTDLQELEEMHCFGDELSPHVLEWIGKNNLWNIWVPKSFGGLEMSLPNGLKMLQSLARANGSLGWTVTLCSGANFFIGNLNHDVAETIFNKSTTPICFGGSGGATGTAQINGNNYVLNGTWKYATGAPYLTHFTLNAKVQKEGKDVLCKDGAPIIRSFLLNRQDVAIIKDWNTIGLRATATHSFSVDSILIDEKYSFTYDRLRLPHSIFRTPFTVFADLTLWVNYIGMAEHFLSESLKSNVPNHLLDEFQQIILKSNRICHRYAVKVHKMVTNSDKITEPFALGLHQEATELVQRLSDKFIKAYTTLGIRACSIGHPLNHIFNDFYTATQHHNFSLLGKL